MPADIKHWVEEPNIRWIFPIAWVNTQATATAAAGRVYLVEFQNISPQTVDRIVLYNFATVAGNVTVGIYGPIATEETAAGAALKVQSASIAMNGANAFQAFTIAATTLVPGRYYVAVEYSDATATYGKINITQAPSSGWGAYFDQAYGVLPDVVPATTGGINVMPTFALRVYK